MSFCKQIRQNWHPEIGCQFYASRNAKLVFKFGAWVAVYLISYLFTKVSHLVRGNYMYVKYKSVNNVNKISQNVSRVTAILYSDERTSRTSSSGIWEMSPRSPLRWFHSKSLKARQDVYGMFYCLYFFFPVTHSIIVQFGLIPLTRNWSNITCCHSYVEF